ncbi:hypothetical protein [Myxococcus sp. AB036A]|nr:hypothetical protein [Myxococcus sp. AB036A]
MLHRRPPTGSFFQGHAESRIGVDVGVRSVSANVYAPRTGAMSRF